MKKFMIATCMMICIAMFIPSANADLIDRGSGLIYDTDLNITWLQDANYAGRYMTWQNAMAWASALEYQGYDDWRLPDIGPLTYSWTTNPAGELPHLGMIEGIHPDHPYPFSLPYQYMWTHDGNSSGAWIFAFGEGQVYKNQWWSGNSYIAWAVRDGDSTPVPEPVTMLLVGSGLIGLAGYGRRRFRGKL